MKVRCDLTWHGGDDCTDPGTEISIEDKLEVEYPDELKLFNELSAVLSLIGDSNPDLLRFSKVFWNIFICYG